MTVQFIDSHLHCPRDGKKLVVDAGQHETAGDLRAVHSCLHCDYSVDQTRPSRALLAAAAVGRLSSWERLRQIRLEGVVVPWAYDTTPFPPTEFDAPAGDEAA